MKGELMQRLVLVVAGLVLLAMPIASQSFPGKGDDYTQTMGKVHIYVAPAFRDLLTGYPGFDPQSRRLVSQVLYDPGTQIGRSAPHEDGSTEGRTGTPVGSANTKVADIDLGVMPAEFKGPAGTREIHTELRSLRMGWGGMSVRAGVHAPGRPASYGEIQSKSGASKDPKQDFPARSFFNVYAEVDMPNMGGQSVVTLYNKNPMLLTDDGLTAFPPSTVYRHSSSKAVEILFKDDNPGKWHKDDVLGFLVLAGHGVKVEVNPFNDTLEAFSENPLALYPGPKGTVAAIQDRQVGGGNVLVLDEPNNTVSTLVGPLPGPQTGWYASAMMMGPFNKDLWLMYLDSTSRTAEIHVMDMCGIRAFTKPLPFAPYGFWRSNNNGIYWAMRDAFYADKIFRTDWNAQELTTVFSGNIPHNLVALCEHEDSGNFVAVSSDSPPTGALSLLDLHQNTVVRWIYGFGRLTGCAFHQGFPNSLYAVEGGTPGAGKLYKVDMIRGTVATIIEKGVDEITSITYNLDQTLSLGACHKLHKFDPRTNSIVRTWELGRDRYQVIRSVAQFGNASLTLDTSKGAGPGSRVPINLSFPHPSAMKAPYVLAASEGLRPGINIYGRYLNLRPSPLFMLSALNMLPTIFQNFQGILDSGGGGQAFVNIPNIPALKGFRMYVGGLVLPPRGKPIIVSNCTGFTIQ